MLNLNSIGRPICKIEGGKYDGHVISVSDGRHQQEGASESDGPGLIKEFRQLRMANDSKLQQAPDTTKEREILYITGPSGSGKSTYTRKFLEQYRKKHRDHPIYLFSSLPEDESLDKIKPQRIRLDENIYEDPIHVEDLETSVVIFDDIDVISDRKIRDAVYTILNNVLEIGRHYNITCVVTNHLPTNGKDTRRILNEAHAVVYFPHSASGKIKYLLTEYLGVDKKMIAHFKWANSRWCCIFKNYPHIYMLEHEVGLLNELDED